MGFSFRKSKGASATEVQTTGFEAHPTDSNDLGDDVAHDVANANVHLKRVKEQHKWDPFMDYDKIDAVDAALASGDAEKGAAVEVTLLQEDSPYMEVRAAVAPTDNPDDYVDTVRAWTIGFIVCTVVGAMNVLLYEHYLQVAITSPVVQLISYPMGAGWAKFVPDVGFTLFGRSIRLNPGPFNKKEHTIVTMMAAAGTTISYAISILIAQQIFYGQVWGWGFQILLIMSTQAMGFGIAGILRRFLIWPAAMVWPATLITTSVMDSLHSHGRADPAATNGWKIGRYHFFLVVAGATFFWQWIPNVIAPFVSNLGQFPTWIAPNNVVVNQVFGGTNGLGFIPGTLDWSGVSGFFMNPLQFPSFAIWNSLFGAVLILVCGYITAFAGADFYKYLPLSANKNFDHFAKPYNTSRILNEDLTLNIEAYEAYSPLLIGPVFTMAYALGFAALMSTVCHVGLFYGKDIYRRTKNARYEEPDIHLKLMRKYPEAPEWWFLSVFVIFFVFAMVASQVWDTKLTWWGFILCILIGVALTLPVGIIQAITSQQTGLNIITEFIVGYMLPGRPIAMMLFKSWGYMLMSNSLTFVQDMKVGHYMKVPPRSMFRAQLFAVVWLSLVQIATFNFLVGNIPEFCSEDQPQGFTCPGATTFYNASVIWGVVGPKRMFGPGALFSWINYFWLIGAACTTIHYFVARRYPRSIARYVYFPAIFSIGGMIPPATLWNLTNWLLVGAIFNIWIMKKYKGWWSQYTYVMAGALDVGNAICIVLFALGLGLSASSFPEWWGTTISSSTSDAMRTARTKFLPADGVSFMGPPAGSW
ncbi:Tetrapeptide transporter, OPT1/isp4 [Truncatella angustata]|uniref:Tetrapeptide transporter, OPT1/isp4 n=1 Tax=Truncatella angustata TaxID=152316 RepID=A0A9P9A0M5_9PEZI|nr:Tetrapeptide transporter, OPT1/isp4 [Truncatella angustata]KAH6658562.1 Tetrapeptide transporter, OPT1/isp4 [Truncatella angustata]